MATDDERGDRIGLVLSATQAIEIYKCKLSYRHPNSFESCLRTTEARIKGQSVPVAERFGVSPKTVRDIWNRRTWAYTTSHLWHEEESSEMLQNMVSCSLNGESGMHLTTIFIQGPDLSQRKRGRPKGSRDSKPRNRANLPVSPLENSLTTEEQYSIKLKGLLACPSLPKDNTPSNCFEQLYGGACVAFQTSPVSFPTSSALKVSDCRDSSEGCTLGSAACLAAPVPFSPVNAAKAATAAQHGGASWTCPMAGGSGRTELRPRMYAWAAAAIASPFVSQLQDDAAFAGMRLATEGPHSSGGRPCSAQNRQPTYTRGYCESDETCPGCDGGSFSQLEPTILREPAAAAAACLAAARESKKTGAAGGDSEGRPGAVPAWTQDDPFHADWPFW